VTLLVCSWMVCGVAGGILWRLWVLVVLSLGVLLLLLLLLCFDAGRFVCLVGLFYVGLLYYLMLILS